MKEGLLAPASVVSLRDVPGTRWIVAESNGGLRIGAMTTLEQSRGGAGSGNAIPRSPPQRAIGKPADPQCRDARRQSAAAASLLVFRALGDHCLRKGGGHCFAIAGENQYHAIFDNRFCAIVHPSTAATALVALGATVELSGADGGARVLALEDFFIGPDKDVQRENALEAGEILTAVRLPPPAGLRTAHLKLAEKASFDWPLADVAVVLTTRHRTKSAAAHRSCWRRRADAASRARGRSRPDRADDRGGGAREAAARRSPGRTAVEERLQAPMFETLVRRAVLQAAKQT